MTTPSNDDDPGLVEYLAGFVTPHKLALFDRLLAERTRHVTVVLEDVYQVHNASACLRSCDAFGVQDVHVVERDVPFRPDGEIALGASQWLTLHHHANAAGALDVLRERGYRVVATSPVGRTRSLYEFDVDEPIAIAFGTELTGLTTELLDGADEHLCIPMHGFSESFNVSVAVALCLQHFTVRLRNTEVDWRLSPSERLELRGQWIRAAIGEKWPLYVQRYEHDTGR